MVRRRIALALAPLGLALVAFAGGCIGIGKSDLQKAVQAHDAAMVEKLLVSGASTGPTLAEPTPARKLALLEVGNGDPAALRVLELMITHDPGLPNEVFSNTCKTRNCGSTSAIELVAQTRNVEAVKLLVRSGLDVHSQGMTDAVVFMIAESGDDVARLLVESGADLNSTSTAGNRFGEISPLGAARRSENPAMVEFLMAHGAR